MGPDLRKCTLFYKQILIIMISFVNVSELTTLSAGSDELNILLSHVKGLLEEKRRVGKFVVEMARIKPQTLLLQSKKKKGPTRATLTTIILCNLVVVVFVFSLVATYRHYSQRRRNLEENGFENQVEDSKTIVDLKKFDLPNFAILNTSKGLITVELSKEASPEIVDSFIDLCQKGNFKGMLFHRVIKNYVIQAGDFQRLGAAEDWTSKAKPHGQFPNSLKHEAFMLGTLKAKQDTKGFELFITTAPIPDLNDKLIVFGRVIKGEDVVQEIEEVDTDEHYRPKSPIGIINVTLRHAP